MAKKVWQDHEGNKVPAKFIPAIEKKKESVALSIYKTAIGTQRKLADLKRDAFTKTDALWQEMLRDAKITKEVKGNYTISTFDKDIKVEVKVQQTIDFDDNITLAHEKIKEYLALKLSGDIDGEISEIVNRAFSTSKGKMDVKRVLDLLKYSIKHKTWLEAMELVSKSITRNHSKRYMRIWKKDEMGQYQNIDLNFSSIEASEPKPQKQA